MKRIKHDGLHDKAVLTALAASSNSNPTVPTMTLLFPEYRLHINRGESILLTGHKSGCGKSRFLHYLAGLLPWPAGVSAIWNGQAWPQKKHDPSAVRMLFDLLPLPWLGSDVAEEISFGLPTWPDREMMATALAEWHLKSLELHTPVQSLNRLQAVCVTLAAASLAKPKLLLLDNPVASLPRSDAEWLRENIRTWAKETGCIVISACSRWQDWEGAVDSVWWIHEDNQWPVSQEVS